ncbi:MAG TPA: HIT domain-containing protein [Patescibacteria group bacterium]
MREDMNESGLDLSNARKEEQIDVMKKIITDGVCPFCHDFVEKIEPAYHSNPILVENDSWIATRNAWPYDNTKEHLVLVIKRHILTPEEMTQEEIVNLWDVIKKVKQELGITHSTLLMRSDSTGKTGATVQHLHAQLIVASDEGIVLTRVG